MSPERRARLRRLLYLVGLVPSVLVTLISLRIVLLVLHEDRGLSAYDRGDYDVASEEFGGNRLLNPVERWVAPFDQGGARYRLEDFTGAVEAFTVALAVAPADQECAVRVNLALAYEGMGDASAQSAELGDAEDSWRRGVEALADCPDRRTDAVRSTAETVEARLLDKLGEALEPPLEPPAEPPPPEDDLEARKQELERQNEQAREKRRDSQEKPESLDSDIPQW